MKKQSKYKSTLLRLLLGIMVLSLMVLGFLKVREFYVVHDFYRRYYWTNTEQLDQAQREHLSSQEITISVGNLKLLDKGYARSLRHRSGGTLIIRVIKPYGDQKIDFEFINHK